MVKPLVVTGYINLNSSYRADDQYRRLGKLLKDAVPDLSCFEGDMLPDCWLMRHLPGPDMKGDPGYTCAIADNPFKNTTPYHIIQHQKVDWMRQALNMHPAREVLVWIDYAIFHMPDVTATVIQDFLKRAADETGIAIPGCWPPNRMGEPSWRFCGSVLVCNANHVGALDAAIKRQALHTLKVDRRLTFEVNTWAAVEQNSGLPIRWYRADHDATLFTDY